MTFTTTIYKFKKTSKGKKNKIAFWAFVISLAIIIGMREGMIPENYLVALILMIIAIVTPTLIDVSSMFKKEKHRKRIIASLSLDKNGIQWNSQNILWDDIKKITITLFDYEGRFIGKGKWNYENNISNGLDNEISITLKNESEYQGNILMASKDQIAQARKVLWHVVKNNNLSYENAKGLINPKNYEEHQEIKKYCK